MARTESEIHLYCRKVLIQSKAKALFPNGCASSRVVVDSEDLPLNISRETMQDSSLMQKLNQVLTGRFLKFLENRRRRSRPPTRSFYEQYSRFFEGRRGDGFRAPGRRRKLLRYESSALAKGAPTSLADYVKRMGGEQKEYSTCWRRTARPREQPVF